MPSIKKTMNPNLVLLFLGWFHRTQVHGGRGMGESPRRISAWLNSWEMKSQPCCCFFSSAFSLSVGVVNGADCRTRDGVVGFFLSFGVFFPVVSFLFNWMKSRKLKHYNWLMGLCTCLNLPVYLKPLLMQMNILARNRQDNRWLRCYNSISKVFFMKN